MYNMWYLLTNLNSQKIKKKKMAIEKYSSVFLIRRCLFKKGAKLTWEDNYYLIQHTKIYQEKYLV